MDRSGGFWKRCRWLHQVANRPSQGGRWNCRDHEIGHGASSSNHPSECELRDPQSHRRLVQHSLFRSNRTARMATPCGPSPTRRRLGFWLRRHQLPHRSGGLRAGPPCPAGPSVGRPLASVQRSGRNRSPLNFRRIPSRHDEPRGTQSHRGRCSAPFGPYVGGTQGCRGSAVVRWPALR